MNIFDNIPDTKDIFNYPVLTIGNFDGLHIGHKRIIQKLISVSDEKGRDHIVITFKQHPRSVIFPGSKFEYLLTRDEKLDELRKLGIKNVIMMDFDFALSRMSPVDFVNKILISRIGVSAIVMGYDHSFGRKREGNIDNLVALSANNFELFHIEPEISGDHPVSSTRIRNELHKGNVDESALLLDKFYYLNGAVVKGEQRGRKMGFPTANVGLIDETKVIPGDGVYAVHVRIADDKKTYSGMCNIGYNPTFGNTNKTVEVNIFDFDRDIYEEKIHVEFIEKVRDEIKFNSLDDLMKQLFADNEHIRYICSRSRNKAE
ncbi:MAG: bifunctional riboflavin kinase/FAD synthetase [Spirochaetes bacterium]|nr:bifunctional riboflavin kinase/FAD synthetase [Spirochaetota bacterium]